jgi:glycerophosphoryl diester phosphodiesterase
MLRIGHRGAAGHAPENTLLAIEKAIALGVDFVELDLQRTCDGHMIIMHDKRVDRTTNGSGCVAQMKLDQLRKLDAGDGQSVPTLEDVLDRCRGRTGLMLEIVSQGSAEQVLRTVSKHDFRGPVIFASFLHAEVLRIKQIQRSAVTLALLEGVPVHSTDFATQAEVSHVGLSIDSLTSDILRSLKSNGFGVFVYTVNDPRDIIWLSSLGADGVISDFPERVT